ncbi:hypothetical protein FSARC_13126 [Fusarium sarcochroum]|uniref:Ent-kaurene synthase n=1 Tax=Fusarium sarcochroum TaxID=1208366 RepID=A0A8H4T3G7_9HYPO|nr:hypothetical protein FSARC_13126 [Fusarium sarcochroum]
MNIQAQSLPADASLSVTAKSLIRRLHATYHDHYGLSTTSCQVYDTAWVSMISKTSGDTERWLFPESFYYLLKKQSDDGSWGSHPSTKTAGILGTAAALLAMLKHAKKPLQIHHVSLQELSRRIGLASASLQTQLASWDDISETNHIGVEMIVPSLLAYLAKQDAGLTFDFPCKEILKSMNESKLSHFEPASLYGNKPSSAIHSLESFIGMVDFDRISHHLYHGSMLASPSSTAAYLIEASEWSDEAEGYLRHIVQAGTGHGDGGIPGTYPTTHFEISWTIVTLLQNGYTRDDLDCPELYGLAQILIKAFQDENGIIGFELAPRAPDVDDTAKALLALSMLDWQMSPDPMIKAFEKSDHFATFGSERDPSFTSNCHVLLALLYVKDISQYGSQILKTTSFLCDFWWESDYLVKDKWHLSRLYPTMLLVDAFTELLRVLDTGSLPGVIVQRLHYKAAICLVQSVHRVLLTQQSDGSWDQMPEQTCYAILALKQASKCCFLKDIANQMLSALEKGVYYLKSCSLQSPDHNWTSKTTYNVSFVAEAYNLAAPKNGDSPTVLGSIGHSLDLATSQGRLEGFSQLLSNTPLFSSLPAWQVRASLLESTLFIPLLKEDRLRIYKRDEMPVAEDKYLYIIPFTWVGCNNRTTTFASTSLIYEMMLLSLFGYQTDEFVESTAKLAFPDSTGLHQLIDEIVDSCDEITMQKTSQINGSKTSIEINDADIGGLSPSISAVRIPLTRFVTYVMNHERVLKASSWDRECLQRELRVFLHAHSTHNALNTRFQSQSQEKTDVFTSSTQSFFQWVRTTGADHVACAYSFFFLSCLISSSIRLGSETFPTVSQKYLSAAAVRHLTTTCRMYNDYGSLNRDTAERNVNSMHFPEFSRGHARPHTDLAERREALTQLAEYEGDCLTRTLELLGHEMIGEQVDLDRRGAGGRVMAITNFYCDVTALYNQLYVLKDLSSTMK